MAKTMLVAVVVALVACVGGPGDGGSGGAAGAAGNGGGAPPADKTYSCRGEVGLGGCSNWPCALSGLIDQDRCASSDSEAEADACSEARDRYGETRDAPCSARCNWISNSCD